MAEQKKKSGCLKTILAGLACMLALPLIWLAFNYRPLVSDGQPLARISAETTRITEPLDENGDVDFLEALNIRASEGITPENNAAILYTRAWGNIGYEPEAFFDEYLSRLELDKSSIIDAPFIEPAPWIPDEYARLSIDGNSFDSISPDNLHAQFDYVIYEYAPWSVEQFPSVARWMEDNREAMELVRAATKREQCYFPLVSKSEPRTLGALLPHTQKIRDSARYFIASSSLHLRKGETDQFLEDLRCIERMSYHLASCPTFLEKVVGNSLVHLALSQAEKACVSDLKSEDLKKVIDFVANLQLEHDLASRMDQCERLIVLDLIVSMGRGKGGGFAGRRFIDWNEVLIFANEEFDRFVEVCKTEDAVEFSRKCDEAEDRLRQHESDVVSSELASAAVFGRGSKGKVTGKFMIAQFTPAFKGIGESGFKVRSIKEMVMLSLAVTAYRNDNDSLPDNLEQLVPQYLDAIPTDTYTSEPFELSETDFGAGFRVHSKEWLDSEVMPDRDKSIAPDMKSFEDYLQER